MPKGQYPRKPRNAEPEAVEPAAPASLYHGDATHFPSEPPRVYTDPAEVSEPFHFEPNEVQARMMAEEQAKARPTTWFEEHVADPANTPDWSQPEVPAPAPAYDGGMVSAKVHAWAGAVCNIRHEVSWQPVRDSRALEVLLITEHGASRLTAPAGNWTASDIDQALQKMRADLMV